MKITKRAGSTISADTDMTPMIDMCFQLIAFFMIVINFSEAEQDNSVRVPSSELAKPTEEAFADQLTLQMKADGEILFGGNNYSLDDIKGALDRHKRVMDRLGQKTQDVTVIVRADREAKTGAVQELIQHCQSVGFDKYALRARQTKSGG